MINAFTYSHPFLFPLYKGGNREQVSVAGFIWTREHVGNRWEQVGFLTNLGNGSGTSHPLNVHVCQGIPREQVKVWPKRSEVAL